MRHIVFDMDDTLLVPRGDWRGAWLGACAQEGVSDRRALEVWVGGRGRAVFQSARLVAGDDDQAGRIEDRFWDLAGECAPAPVDGAHEALELARRAGVVCHLSSGSPPRLVESHLRALGWHDRFAVALGSTPSCCKGRDHYRLIVAASGVGGGAFAACSAAIGDGEAEMRHAAELGVTVRVGLTSNRTDDATVLLAEAGATHVTDGPLDAVRIVLGAGGTGAAACRDV